MTQPTKRFALNIMTPTSQKSLIPSANDAKATLSDLLRKHSLPLNTRCGQRSLCDGCVIELLRGKLENIHTGELLEHRNSDRPLPIRSCAYRLHADDEVCLRIPERALMMYKPQVLSDFQLNSPRAHQPIWTPTKQDPTPAITPPIGAAIDIGTTTVAVMLVDLETGKPLAKTTHFNQQLQLGDDVLTRISHCLVDHTLVDRLQELIVNKTISPLLDEALKQIDADRSQLVCITVTGNTTMLHLFAGVDPSSMGVAPFTPTFTEHRTVRMRDVDFAWPMDSCGASSLPRNVPIHLLPSVAAYIGADLAAGIVASGLFYDEEPSLLVDVGTNGEMILKADGKLYACATAAGPAFEGSRLTDGMRAGQGTIAHIDLQREPFNVHIETIGQSESKKRLPPIGLCGSAYVDFLAQAAQIGLITHTGRLNQAVVPENVRKRYFGQAAKCYGSCFHVAYTQGKESIVISEYDISALLQAKAAIAAGIMTLLEKTGYTPAQVKTLYLAGGFGMNIRIASAIRAGLLPGFQESQIQLIGNSSLAGAYIAMLDRTSLDEMNDIIAQTQVVELNLEPNFENHYLDQLTLKV